MNWRWLADKLGGSVVSFLVAGLLGSFGALIVVLLSWLQFLPAAQLPSWLFLWSLIFITLLLVMLVVMSYRLRSVATPRFSFGSSSSNTVRKTGGNAYILLKVEPQQ